MVKKISRTVLLIIAMVLTLVAGYQIALRQYQISSDHLLQEYDEMHALEEFKLSLIQYQKSYLESDVNFNQDTNLDLLLSRIRDAKHNCEVFVTQKHLGATWKNILEHYTIVQTLDFREFSRVKYSKLDLLISQILVGLDSMILETREEIVETENRNNTLLKHTTITLLTFGIAIVIIISILTISTAKGITKPIQEFLYTFKKLGAGERHIRVNVEREDEFRQLANEFNTLFDKLEDTTVTLEYFRNIIDSIDGALFVTDQSGKILSYNKTVTKLLGFNNTDLVSQDIASLFLDESQKQISFKQRSQEAVIQSLIKAEKVISKSGKAIPTLTTCTSFMTNSEEYLITVVHDITEKLAYQKELEETKRKSVIAINTAQEAQRTRIATELHDSLGQKLSAINYAFQDTYNCINDQSKINEIQHLLDEAISETRTISHSIMPGVLKDFGLCAALNDLIDSSNKLNNVNFNFNHFDFEERVDPTIEKVLYRISQELVNNILRHSEADKAIIQLFKTTDQIIMTIEDNGIGFNLDILEFNEHDGIGLLSIKERISSYNGEFTLNSAPGKGTEIIVEIPCQS